MPDYVYESPPLIEVIAELHWKLEPLGMIQNAAIDPHFKILQEELRTTFAKAGFGFVERLIPEEFPIEMLAHKPVVRFRPAPDLWPVYQVGPGIFTVNNVPPYNGWGDFKAMAIAGIGHLLECYPMPEKFMKLKKLELRYIDAFTKKHGMSEKASFFNQLGIQLSLPRGLVENSIDGGAEGIAATIDTRFPLRNLQKSTGVLRVGAGRANNEPAVMVEMRARTTESLPLPRIGDFWPWFDAAHEELRQWFEWAISEDMRRTFGPKKELQA